MPQEILRMRNINKSFPGVQALKHVDFDLKANEIHALLGENGAGKSTLMNVLMGMHRPEEGEIWLHGKKTEIPSPVFAIQNSIGIVPQELNIVPEVTVAENICMGTQKRKAGAIIDWKDTFKRAESIMDQLGSPVNVRSKAGTCSVAQLQMVQIARAIAFGAKIIILDEPTASLTSQETHDLFRVMRQLKGNGAGIIFITHHLEEVKEVADRVTVMRDGEVVDTTLMADTSIKEIIAKMAGQEVIFSKFEREFQEEEVVLRAERLTHKKKFRDVSFEVKKGEIFGVGGLVGAGRTEVMLALFGVEPLESGTIILKGKPITVKSPKSAIEAGIGYLPEERRAQAIFPILSIKENLTMPILQRLFRHGKIDRRQQEKITQSYIDRLEIKTPSGEKEIRDLSGGNQQKVVFGRWIEKDLDILILDEPTRGIDVRAKDEIHKLIESLAKEGKTVIVVSSELEELLNICDRIMIMNEGQVKGIMNAREVNQEEILRLALS